ncbi:MAG: hypothetical protein JXR25_11860 [Pontiellaceae bacterium]|nr:hypothetical protein [Pontiellaceae bacterium]
MSVGAVEGHPSYQTAGLIPELYADEFNVEYYNKEILPNITTTKFMSEMMSMGEKITIPQEPDIQRETYYRGKKLNLSHGTHKAPIEMRIDRAADWNIMIDDVDKKQSHMELIDKYKARGIKKESEAQQAEFFADIYTQAHADNQGANAGTKSHFYNLGTAGAPLGLTTENLPFFVTALTAVLGEQNADDAGKMWACIPGWLRTLFLNSKFGSSLVMGDSSSILRTGRMGMIDDMEFYKTNQLHTSTADQATGTYVIAGNKDAISYAQQINSVESIRPDDMFADGIKGLNVYDWNVRKSEGLVVAYVYCADTSLQAA